MSTIPSNDPLYKVAIKEWQQLPQVARQFAVRALLLLAFWFVAYRCMLRPNGKVDNWLSYGTTQTATYLLDKYYAKGFAVAPWVQDLPEEDKHFQNYLICLHQTPVLSFSKGCNALELYALYVWFLSCVPGSTKKKVLYSFFGTMLIFMVNILRLFAMTWVVLNEPQWVDFAHHYAFTTIVYAIIFSLWVMFLQKKAGEE